MTSYPTRSDDVPSAPLPKTWAELAAYIVWRFGMATFGLITLVVVVSLLVGSALLTWRELSPGLTVMVKDMQATSVTLQSTAQMQITTAQMQSEAVDRFERVMDRLDRLNPGR